jgi:hypothetical protein
MSVIGSTQVVMLVPRGALVTKAMGSRKFVPKSCCSSKSKCAFTRVGQMDCLLQVMEGTFANSL